jgi:hypothetical protein
MASGPFGRRPLLLHDVIEWASVVVSMQAAVLPAADRNRVPCPGALASKEAVDAPVTGKPSTKP